jgi:catechol-2,3-dioxygenase
VEILKNGSDKVVDFPAWNAKSVYFYDADNNILEFISRKDLFQQMDQDFSSNSLLGLSEIGLATKDVEEKYKVLNELSGMEIYTGDTNIFCATGDKEGLFIIVNKHKKKWFPSGDKAYSSAFEIKFVVNNITYSAAYENESLRIL